MARHPFGLTASDWTFSAQTVDTTDNVAVLAGGATITFYNAQSGGSQLTDLALDAAGTSPVNHVTSSDGSDGYLPGTIPVVYGPDNVASMWASADGGPRVLTLATDIGDLAVVTAQALASHTGAANPHNTAVGDLTDTDIPPIGSRNDGNLLGWSTTDNAFVLLPPSAAAGAVLQDPPKVGGVYVGQTIQPPDPTQGGSGNPQLQAHQPYSSTDNNPDMWQFFATGPSGNAIKAWWLNGNNENRRAPSANNRCGARDFEFAEGAGGPSVSTFVEWSTNPANALLREKLLAGYGTGHSTKPGWVEATRIISALQGVAAGGNFNSLTQAIFRGRSSTAGAPTSGTWSAGDWILDVNGRVQLCTTSGTPGTWVGAVAPTAWADLPGLGTNVSHGTPHCQYRVEGDVVRMKGQLVYGGAVTTLGTLPAGARPPAAVVLADRVRVTGVAGSDITIATTGVITTNIGGTATQTQNFDGLTFTTS